MQIDHKLASFFVSPNQQLLQDLNWFPNVNGKKKRKQNNNNLLKKKKRK